MGKYNFDLLNTFCNENNIKLLEDYKNSYLKHNSKILLECKQCFTPFYISNADFCVKKIKKCKINFDGLTFSSSLFLLKK